MSTSGNPFRFAFQQYENVNKPVRFYNTSVKTKNNAKSGPVGGMVVLPVPPEIFSWSASNGIEEVTSVTGRSFIHSGPEPLETISLESFFPFITLKTGIAKTLPTLQIPDYIPQDSRVQGLYQPETYRDIFTTAMIAAQPFNFTISWPGTAQVLHPPIPAVITAFDWEYRSGHGRDIFYTMTIKKWNPQVLDKTRTRVRTREEIIALEGEEISTAKVEAIRQSYLLRVKGGKRGGPSRTVSKYKIRSNDTLWAIADRYLGDGAKWVDIYAQNSDILDKALTDRGIPAPNVNILIAGTIIRMPEQGSL